MKKLRKNSNKCSKNKGTKKVILCILSLILMLAAGCTNNKNNSPAASGQGQETDSTAQDLPSTATETATSEALSVFDELDRNMVYVEKDSASFYICKYEVTQKLWKEVMAENPSQRQGDELPVEQVSWDDCQTFISKLNKLTGKVYRLPTEAEWEYACKGGKHSKGYKYSGSDDIDKVAWYSENSEETTHPVGQKQPNELGLYDMSGNVWEWCQDMHDGTGMCRGGSWIHNARNCDPSLPNDTPRPFSIDCLGLRLAL